MLRCGASTEAEDVDILPCADEAEQTDVEQQSWPGLFWLPPADDGPNERKLLRLDDELAGLIEAADTPADQAGTHSTKPEPIISVPGEGFAYAQQVSCCCVHQPFWQMHHTLIGILLHDRVVLCGVVASSVVLQHCMLCLSFTARCACQTQHELDKAYSLIALAAFTGASSLLLSALVTVVYGAVQLITHCAKLSCQR